MEERQVRQIDQHGLNLAGKPSNKNNGTKNGGGGGIYIEKKKTEKSPGSLVLLDSTGDQIIQEQAKILFPIEGAEEGPRGWMKKLLGIEEE